ncbi:BQ2448_2157 [Microbotryum intermedium]|uniref:BQ2448_2157 protein n=1 Tax=Microbotryum intermedium TaxID=269621 RepID=A0A238F7K8_9BASI|nr:BQ2448_2157 [Microbotryum intermedium]
MYLPSARGASYASRSPSPPSHRRRQRDASPPALNALASTIEMPQIRDHDPVRRRERERQMALDLANAELKAATEQAVVPRVDPVQEMKQMASTKGGGAYIPPHRLRAMLAQQAEKDASSAEYQRLTWEALRKSLNGLINKVTASNIKLIVPTIFGENLIRGRGLFARSIMRAQASSLPFTPVFASLVSVINSKLPQVGELLVHRLIHQFKRSLKRNDKVSPRMLLSTGIHPSRDVFALTPRALPQATLVATTMFIAHLVNHSVVWEALALEIFFTLLTDPTDDSVEIAVTFMREVGATLSDSSARATNQIFDEFRKILNESIISKRVQYMVEVLFQVRRDKFEQHPKIGEGLDLVEEEDLIMHNIELDDADIKVQEMLNVFKFDPNYEENEAIYAEMKRDILGDSEDEDESAEDGDTEDSDEEGSEDEPDDGIKADGTVDVHDQTGANLVNLRRTIYLTIMSALDFEEAVHKLLRIHLPDHQAGEMCNMIIECCSQERTYSKFYGLMGERFAKLNRMWTEAYEQCFQTYYDTIHRYETNRLRNIARFFGHLLATDAIAWSVLEHIRMNEDDTTSSSRIFIKIMFQEVTEGMGLKKLKERLAEESMQPYLTHIFPIDNPKNTRFSINFFTSIGLGAVTEEMREHLKRAPQIMLEQRRALEAEDSSDSDTTSSSESSLSSSSLSSSSYDSRRHGGGRKGRSRSRSYSSKSRSSSRSPVRRDGKIAPRRRSPSVSRSRSRSRSVSRSRSRTRSLTPPRRRYDSRSPPPRSRYRDDSRSPPRRRGSPPPRRGRDVSRSPPPAKRRSPSPDRSKDGAVGGGTGSFIHPSRLALQQGGGPGGPRGSGNDRYGNRPPRQGFQNREGGLGYDKGGGRGFNNAPPRDNGYGNRGGGGGR